MVESTSNLECVNQASKQLFTQNGRSIEGIPPTKAALIQHTNQATYQAGYCCCQVMIATPELPSPSDWNWIRKEQSFWEVQRLVENLCDVVARKVIDVNANV